MPISTIRIGVNIILKKWKAFPSLWIFFPIVQTRYSELGLGAIHILRKKNSGWVGLQNAYNCLFTLDNQTHFCIILLIMWVGGLKNRQKCAYVIYVWSLINLLKS